MAPSVWKIMLADDHQLFLDGLTTLVQREPDLEVVGIAANGAQLLEMLQATPADLLLLDLNMPQMTGIEVLAQLKQRNPRPKVLVVSNYKRHDLLTEARAAGAQGYVLKNTPVSDLLTHCRTILGGGTYFYDSADEAKTQDDFFKDPFWARYQLTRREVEMIRLLAKSLSSKEIADMQNVSIHTVETHRRNIMHKLNVQNVAGIISFAYENGIL